MPFSAGLKKPLTQVNAGKKTRSLRLYFAYVHPVGQYLAEYLAENQCQLCCNRARVLDNMCYSHEREENSPNAQGKGIFSRAPKQAAETFSGKQEGD
jgi:hypothetical protein